MTNAQSSRFLSRVCRQVDTCRSAIAGVCVLTLMQCAALAQDEPLRPPRVNDAPSAPKVMVFLVLLLLTAGLVFAATMKTKRGHQD